MIRDAAGVSLRFAPSEDVLPGAAPGPLGAPPLGALSWRGLYEQSTLGLKLTLRRLFTPWQARRIAPISEGPFSMSERMYLTGDQTSPTVASRWQDDRAFVRQRLAGLSAWYLRRVDVLPRWLAVGDDALARFARGLTLREAMAEGRLFGTDQGVLEGIPWAKGDHGCAPFVLFVLADGRLHLVGIQLSRDPARTPFLTPASEPGAWLAAKMWANCCDLQVTVMAVHALTCHMVMEAFLVAGDNALGTRHPVARLLAPHGFLTVASSWGLRAQLAEGGSIAAVMGIGARGGLELRRRAFAAWSMRCMNPRLDVADRGVGDVPGYLYRDDAFAHWDAVSAYTQEMVHVLYRSDGSVAEDDALQAWIVRVAELGVRGVPCGPDGRMSTRGALAELLARLIFTATAMHNMMQNAATEDYALVHSVPASFDLPPPDGRTPVPLERILAALPSGRDAVEQMAQAHCVDRRSNAEGRLGRLPAGYMAAEGPEAVAAVGRWQARLAELEAALLARNERLGDEAFTHLLPSRGWTSAWV